MGLLLISLLIGIFASPCLDRSSVWAAIPFTMLMLTLPSRRGRTWILHLLVALIGAADASMIATVMPVPTETAVRVVGGLRKAPEWHGLGTYLDLELQSVDDQPYQGRARLKIGRAHV